MTEEEIFSHLRGTFDAAVRQFPDLMEPYVTRIADLSQSEQKFLMRTALAETFSRRFPPRHIKTEAA